MVEWLCVFFFVAKQSKSTSATNSHHSDTIDLTMTSMLIDCFHRFKWLIDLTDDLTERSSIWLDLPDRFWLIHIDRMNNRTQLTRMNDAFGFYWHKNMFATSDPNEALGCVENKNTELEFRRGLMKLESLDDSLNRRRKLSWGYKGLHLTWEYTIV